MDNYHHLKASEGSFSTKRIKSNRVNEHNYDFSQHQNELTYQENIMVHGKVHRRGGLNNSNFDSGSDSGFSTLLKNTHENESLQADQNVKMPWQLSDRPNSSFRENKCTPSDRDVFAYDALHQEQAPFHSFPSTHVRKEMGHSINNHYMIPPQENNGHTFNEPARKENNLFSEANMSAGNFEKESNLGVFNPSDSDTAEEDDLSSDDEDTYNKINESSKELVDKYCGSRKPSSSGTADLNLECLVCKGPQRYKGWKALKSHAEKYQKKKVQLHQAFYKALEHALELKEKEGQGEAEKRHIDNHTSFIDSSMAEGRKIVWPPCMILEINKQIAVQNQRREISDSYTDESIRNLLSEEFQGLNPTNILPCGKSMFFVIFEANSIGYLEATEMNRRFLQKRQGREDMKRKYTNFNNVRKVLTFGYLANPADMEILDPERAIVKDWKEESYYEKVQLGSKRMKKENEDKQVEKKVIEQKVSSLDKQKKKVKDHKELLAHKIKDTAKEIEEQRMKTEERRKHFEDEERKLSEDFQNFIDKKDREYSSKLNGLKEKLEIEEENQKQQRMHRMAQIEKRRKELQLLKDNQKIEEEKLLDKEDELIARRRNFMAEVQQAENAINEKIRLEEEKLQEDQQEEMLKLLRECNNERAALVEEWLKEQDTLGKDVEDTCEKGKDVEDDCQKEMTPECSVCWDDLTPENRALFWPCGHARTCLRCALSVYNDKRQKRCPLCMTEIKAKPTLCPEDLYKHLVEK